MMDEQELINQVMRDDPDAGINAMAAMAMFEALSKKVAECHELIEQYKKTYPDIMHGGVAIVIAAGLFSTAYGDTDGMMPVELVEGYRGAARNLVTKLLEDVES